VEFAAPTNLVFIPPGTFRMGSPTNELDRNSLNDPIGEGPQMAVTIGQGFWMGKYEVTQGEYLAVMGINPSLYNGDQSGGESPFNQNYGTDLNRPVERVSWFDATNYCGKLTRREQTAGRIPVGSQFRLPTEAEWEYACRAGISTRFSYGDDLGYDNLAQYAWYVDDSGGTTHPVGQKLPNLWGLYDMSGNVWEWCQDRPAPYPGGIALDPQGPNTGTDRIMRGGSCVGPGAGMRSAQRIHNPPTVTLGNTGFRIVLAPSQP
jgi:formylglycine-generating enzyme required for sulfatase activity